MVPFGGWEMPVQYASILEEHRTVRRAVGLFDVSHMGEFEVTCARAFLPGTGSRGGDGFELYVAAGEAERLWRELLDRGRAAGVAPVGLGARDTLRLEMRYVLYGNDIDLTTNPLEAGLGWVVKPAKGDFIGRDAIEKVRAAGVPRRLVRL